MFNAIKHNCGAQTIYGPGPSTWGKSEGPSRGGLWPKLDQIAYGHRRGRLSPRQTQSSPLKGGQKRYRTETRTKDLKYPRKAALTAIQYSEPDRAAVFDFYNHPQRL